MKLIKFVSLFLFLFTCFTSFAHENEYIFVGQSGSDGKTAFVLDLASDDLGDMQINENGEVYLKVDKIIAIPRTTFYNFVRQTLTNAQVASHSCENISHFLVLGKRETEEYVRCSNPDCRRSYYARPGQRNCPWCGTSN